MPRRAEKDEIVEENAEKSRGDLRGKVGLESKSLLQVRKEELNRAFEVVQRVDLDLEYSSLHLFYSYTLFSLVTYDIPSPLLSSPKVSIEQPSSSPDQPTTPLLPRRRRFPLRIPSSLSLKTSISSELSGAVGDLGTYIPIVLTLTLVSHLDLGTTLIFTALYNIASGLLFGVPMPVQPMKSIAAVAVSETPHLTIPQIAAAGLSTAAVLFLLGATGLMSFFYRFIPFPVVRGVQLSQGLAFSFSAIKYIRFNQDFAASKSGDPRPWLGLDGLILALVSVLFLVLTTGAGDNGNTHLGENPNAPLRRRLRILSAIPGALIVFALGLFLCFVRDPTVFKDLKLGPSRMQLVKITWEDWKIGFLRAAIPQIPLSVLNSVIAVCKLSADLFPEREVSATAVSMSVGAMNFVGCWFGAMPVCHGAGGLAGQYRFGGRSGASVVFLGIGKLVLGLVFGNSFVRILSEFPIGILGALLLFAGIELAMAARDMNTKEDSFVMLVCAAVSLTGSSAALGFGCGILLFLVLKLRQMECSRLGFSGFIGKSTETETQTRLMP